MKKIVFLITILFATPSFATTVKEIKTPSGFTAWLVEEHSQPLISVNIAFRDSGTAYDPDGKEGRTAVTSAMLLEGAGDMDSQTFARTLESHAIRLSFSTDEDNFSANLEALSEHKQQAFSYLGLTLTKPRFDEDALESVKRRTLSTLKQQQEKPNYRLSRAWQERIFGSHPYSKPELGSEKTVSDLSSDDLRKFTSNYLTRGNIIISVVGDITAEELSSILDKNLGNLPTKYKPDVILVDTTLPNDGKQIVIEQDIPQTIIRFGMKGLKRSDPDYITGYVVNYLLGGGTLTSRFNNEIREKRGLSYSVSSNLIPMQHCAIFMGGFATRNEKAGESLSILKQTLAEFAEKGTNEAELADAKRFLTGSFVVSMDSNSKIVSFLTMMQLYNLGIDYMDKRNNLINSITVKQVGELAKRLIQLDKLQVIMIGKPLLGGNSKP